MISRLVGDSDSEAGRDTNKPMVCGTALIVQVVSISKIHPERAPANASIRVLTSLASL